MPKRPAQENRAPSRRSVRNRSSTRVPSDDDVDNEDSNNNNSSTTVIQDQQSPPDQNTSVTFALPGKPTRTVSRRVKATAAIFARGEEPSLPVKSQSSSQVSSTPTGSFRSTSKNVSGENNSDEEDWPGPFSTARSIIDRREAAKAERLLRLQQQQEGEVGSIHFDDGHNQTDRYDEWLQNAHSDILERVQGQTAEALEELALSHSSIPSLNQLALRVISDNIHLIHYDLEGLSVQQNRDLCVLLNKKKKIDSKVAVRLASPYSRIYELPDCAQVDEDSLLQALQVVLQVNLGDLSNDDEAANLFQLSLRHCGRCISDRVIRCICDYLSNNSNNEFENSKENDHKTRNIKHKVEDEDQKVVAPKQLEVLNLMGCFKVSDQSLLLLLSICQESLYELSITYSNRISYLLVEGARKLLHNLRVLSFDFCNHLTDEDILHLVPSHLREEEKVLPSLQQLSLNGLTLISDAVVCALMPVVGKQLTSFSVNHCRNLTANSIISIRTHCCLLQRLDVSDLGDIDVSTWLGLFLVDGRVDEDGQRISSSSSAIATPCLGPLEKVDISCNPNITDEVVIALCESYRRSLQTLNLSSCSHLTDRSIAAIANNARELTMLDISYVRSVSAIALTACLLRCSRLNTVLIWGNTQLMGGGSGKDPNSSTSLLANNVIVRARSVCFIGEGVWKSL
eukprot:gene5423-5966_t